MSQYQFTDEWHESLSDGFKGLLYEALSAGKATGLAVIAQASPMLGNEMTMWAIERYRESNQGPRIPQDTKPEGKPAEREGQVGELIDRRRQVYGEPTEQFPRMAQIFSGILGIEVNAWQIPLLMIGMKMSRIQTAPDYSDNSDDIEGYLDIFRELIGEDMIHARSVSEYIQQKWPNE